MSNAVPTRVGIMGFGRIGRNVFRLLHGRQDLQVAAIVDVVEPKSLEYLLRFDTVLGRFAADVHLSGSDLYSEGRQIPIIHAVEPGEVDWEALGIELVVESTGVYRERAQLEEHLRCGARRVLLASPPRQPFDVDLILVRGVNDDVLRPTHRLVSCGSCTLNAVAPVLELLSETFGISQAYMNSVHAYTNRMRLADVPNRDLRASRAAAENIIPTSTYTPRAIGQLLSELSGRLEGLALNVPVPDGSAVDLTLFLDRPATREEINELMRSAAESRYAGILAYSTDPLVSSDVIGESHSAVFDSEATMVLDDLVKVILWYDNGWGYSQRIVEVLERSRKLSR
jgi:glyceraldehyde 3-phosphate dehydrogenase